MNSEDEDTYGTVWFYDLRNDVGMREIQPDFRTSFEEFRNYVNDYYQYGSDVLDWERILFFVIGDDEKAFDVFYELLDKGTKQDSCRILMDISC